MKTATTEITSDIETGNLTLCKHNWILEERNRSLELKVDGKKIIVRKVDVYYCPICKGVKHEPTR